MSAAGDELRAADRSDFSSKKRALRRVAGSVAGGLRGGCYADVFGYDIDDELTEAQHQRLEWAWREVTRRLYAMGGEEPS